LRLPNYLKRLVILLPFSLCRISVERAYASNPLGVKSCFIDLTEEEYTRLKMCGRYYQKSDKQKIAEAFHVGKVVDFPLPPGGCIVDGYSGTSQRVIDAGRVTASAIKNCAPRLP
jgi:hypothetical protein